MVVYYAESPRTIDFRKTVKSIINNLREAEVGKLYLRIGQKAGYFSIPFCPG
jgi:hypothetical protein